jgi:putative transposase
VAERDFWRRPPVDERGTEARNAGRIAPGAVDRAAVCAAPDLLHDLAIVLPNQVWRSDITYIPMRRGFLYLVAIMDWHSRRVLSWRLSNTMDVTFSMEALQEALARHGRPGIFNTDQSSQFTSLAFTQMLRDAGIRISIDGRGRWMDNVFIERLWRSLKSECVYLHAFETGLALHAGPMVDQPL